MHAHKKCKVKKKNTYIRTSYAEVMKCMPTRQRNGALRRHARVNVLRLNCGCGVWGWVGVGMCTTCHEQTPCRAPTLLQARTHTRTHAHTYTHAHITTVHIHRHAHARTHTRTRARTHTHTLSHAAEGRTYSGVVSHTVGSYTGRVHKGPVIVKGVTTEDTDSGVVSPAWHMPLFPVPHCRRHPILRYIYLYVCIHVCVCVCVCVCARAKRNIYKKTLVQARGQTVHISEKFLTCV